MADQTNKSLDPNHSDYPSEGFIPLLCKGYHPKYNPKKDYRTAKEPVFSGWNSPGYVVPTLEEIDAWEKAGGWIGWVIPKGMIVLDVEDPEDAARVRAIYRARGIEPGIHKTNQGFHFCFRTDRELSAASKVFTKSGIELTYRVGGKNYLILAPSNGRTWELWKKPEALPLLPDDFLPYDRKNLSDTLNSLSWQIRKAYREGHFSGYQDIDAALIALIIGCGLTQEQIHKVLEIIFAEEYDQRQTDTMMERTRARLQAGDKVIGAGTFMQKVKDQGLHLIERFVRELQALTERPEIEVGSVTLADNWPSPLAEEALYGLPGEYVKTVEPRTEADPVALLGQFISVCGNVVGPTAYFRVEADRHNLKINPVLVGETSKARKGTSAGHIKDTFSQVDPEWARNRIMSGLSSGEGLMWPVRDEIKKSEPIREKGRITGYQDVLSDPGVSDKRLFVLEPEFAQTLRVIGRDGNTLSPIIRQAWDDGNLQCLTKNSPAKATGAHISIVGHITKDELRRYLDRTEMGNGFANRFIWLCVRRSKVLPEGGHLQGADLSSIISRLREAVEFGKTAGEIKKDTRAMELWAEVYPELSEGKPGLFGAIISRAEAQVMRIACIYALLDKSNLIREEHLLAALAIWDYAEESARYIFGDTTGDPVADRILTALKNSSGGLTRTEINNLFGRNVKAERIESALSCLSHRTSRTGETTEGRPVERWRAL